MWKLDGYKTVIAGVGLLALGLYQATQALAGVEGTTLQQAFESLGLGLTALGLRHAIAKKT